MSSPLEIAPHLTIQSVLYYWAHNDITVLKDALDFTDQDSSLVASHQRVLRELVSPLADQPSDFREINLLGVSFQGASVPFRSCCRAYRPERRYATLLFPIAEEPLNPHRSSLPETR